ncbi:TonB-dependent receptor [Pedobacter sp. HDW13]|uniref:SusC/RagA family TonB-linked outer membrane protein n=1 Tax=unclassified Pedobacter TaxID=2628915 RepID=UPI000F590FB0|nr:MULTISPECIES: TonB-dependent receptor [unclassified Pedobacter]QIL38526.1 TonB-dependent receptor [Pedobacter sp. HDW13]RQO77327.1 SusC/RagA family TonB-linked outer membrane protein [Pedobacter sp. KBW01]
MKRIFTRISVLAVFCLLAINVAFAQNITVKGKVIDGGDKTPLPGVSILIKGTQNGTQTDVNGNYSISVPGNATLVFNFVGYTAQEQAVNNQTTINVSLASSTQQLEQVVVVGYGTQRKIDVTGSVASVKGEDISKQASVNAVSALQGKVAGVNITNSGTPGSTPQITIRGTGTIFGALGVLYVVDGVWYDDISFLNPADIADMSILKDASSQSIYGIRAANGVILVTTNKGKTGNPVINYNGSVGYKKVTNQIEMANATEYATIINELSASNSAQALFANPASYGEGTNWYNQAFRNALQTNHQISINGGTEKTTYNFSLGYTNEDGIVKTQNWKRYTAKFSNDFQVLKSLKLGYSISGTSINSNDINGGIFRQLYAAGPVVPVYYADGTYGDANDFSLGGGNNFNPQVTLDFFNQKSKNYRINGNVYAELTFAKNFTFRTSAGGDFGQNEVRGYTPSYQATQGQRNDISKLIVNRDENRNWILENTLTYKNTFGDHNLTLLAGTTAQRRKNYYINSSALNVPYSSDGDLYLALGTASNREVIDGGSLSTYLSYFGRANYSFKNKYLLNATLRADAASQFFGGGDLWGYFPAVGAGWVISNEDFMKDQNVVNNLKLKGSWGKVGNAGVPLNPTTLTVTQSAGYVAIFNGVAYTGASVASLVPSFLNWERTTGTDIGIEAAFLKNRLNIEASYYNKKTEQAIFEIPILSSIGTSSSRMIGNQADLQNRGFEFLATWRDQPKDDFSYSISANIGINNNKVLSVITGLNPIYNGGQGIANGALATRTVQGGPIGSFFGYQVAGIFQTPAEVAASAQNTSAKPGDFRYIDQNGDGVIDGKDRVVLGNPNPKYSYGINTTFAYKGWDLSFDIQGVADVDVYNANIAYRFGNENFSKDFYDNRWHGAGTSNTYPSANVGSTTNAAPNSFYVEDGSYIRLRTIQLGYALPASLMSKWTMKKVRVFLDAQNAINLFGYKGFTPEIGYDAGSGPISRGIDASVYPLSAIYRLGLQVQF